MVIWQWPNQRWILVNIGIWTWSNKFNVLPITKKPHQNEGAAICNGCRELIRSNNSSACKWPCKHVDLCPSLKTAIQSSITNMCDKLNYSLAIILLCMSPKKTAQLCIRNLNWFTCEQVTAKNVIKIPYKTLAKPDFYRSEPLRSKR